MIFLYYILTAAIVVIFSIKCAGYVDLIDKKTNISGAFIGGVILAAVTSLPELVTSISSIAIGEEGLICGNVLGSNIFNLCIFGALTLFTAKGFKRTRIGSSHIMTLVCTILAYLVTGTVLFFGIGAIPNTSINIASIVIVILYAISCKFMASDEGESDSEDDSSLTLTQAMVRFVLCAVGLVISSVIITYITDIIEESFHLGASLAGAVFLGVATSIPELTSSIALVRRRNYNAMIGNVLGSNMFNYIIFSLADIIAFKKDVYMTGEILPFGTAPLNDSQLLIVFGIISSVITIVSILSQKSKKVPSAVFGVFGVLILASYTAFLVVSAINQ